MAGDFSLAAPPSEQAPHQTVLHSTDVTPLGPTSTTAVASGGPVFFTRSSVDAPAGTAVPVSVPDTQPQFRGTFALGAASSDTGKKGKDPKSPVTLDPFTPPSVSLTVDGLADSLKDNPGALVVRRADGNNAPRQKITISAGPANMVTGVTLTVSTHKVDVYTTADGGAPLQFDGTDNDFGINQLPINLWVQGVDGSDTMRDTQLEVVIDNWPQITNGANFTCLWVDQPTESFAGTVSANNDKRDNYKTWTTAKTYALGPQTFDNTAAGGDYRFGWGDEARAQVHPANFVLV